MTIQNSQFRSLSIRRPLSVVVALAVLLVGGQVGAEMSSKSIRLQERFCGIVNHCGLPARAGTCHDSRFRDGVDSVDYSKQRCAAPLELAKLGVETKSRNGRIVYQYLGHELQVVYDVAGRAAMPAPRLAYLLEEMPLATRLMNEYTNGDFGAEFRTIGGTRWIMGNKGSNFTGRAAQVAGDLRRGKAYYLGYGRAEVMNLDFHGKILLDIDFERSRKGDGLVDYQVTLYSAPANKALYTMMDSHVFHYFAEKLVGSIVGDLARATDAALKDLAGGKLDTDTWSSEEIQQLHFLARLS